MKIKIQITVEWFSQIRLNQSWSSKWHTWIAAPKDLSIYRLFLQGTASDAILQVSLAFGCGFFVDEFVWFAGDNCTHV